MPIFKNLVLIIKYIYYLIGVNEKIYTNRGIKPISFSLISSETFL